MYPDYTSQEAKIEREQVEWVFGLTGGELADRPMRYAYRESANYSTGKMEPHEYRRAWARYSYEGTPEYSEIEPHTRNGSFLTMVWDSGAYGSHQPPTIMHAQGKRWRKVASYTSSGETECPGVDCEEPIPADGCPLCEGSADEGHGMIYLGEGWCEVVYYSRT